MTSSSLLRNTLSGVTAAALAGSSLVVAGTAAKASSLDYDCFSRQTGTLIYKAAVDMTSLEIACVPHSSRNKSTSVNEKEKLSATPTE